MEELEDHFRILPQEGEASTSTTDISGTEDTWHKDPFSNDEVARMRLRTTNRKTAGPDNIAIETIKRSPLMIQLVTRLLNSILMAGKISERWKESTLKPLFEGKGSELEASNYRGINPTDSPAIFRNSSHSSGSSAHGMLPENIR